MNPNPSLQSAFTEDELKRVRELAKAAARRAPRYSKQGKRELAKMLS